MPLPDDRSGDAVHDPYAVTLDTLRTTFRSGRTHGLDWRREQLQALRRMMSEHREALSAAASQDIGKPRPEAELAEVFTVVQEVDALLDNLERWTGSRKVRLPLTFQPATARLQHRPKGVLLVIGPWNYPVQLLLSPLAGALAAGNTVLLKPSEVAPAVSSLVADLVPRYLDPEAVAVVEGGAAEATALLAHRFDHVVFTGSQRVGRIVMRAAAEHLTPVTLELGGKSPVFVDASVHLRTVAQRLVWGKFLNVGQTCVAPDYVMVTPEVHDALVDELRRAIRAAFGRDPRRSSDYGRVVNDLHFDRLLGLLEGTDPVIGGEHERSERYLAPTVVTGVGLDHALMQEEIFGPVLPVLRVAGVTEALEVVETNPHPLSFYVFSEDAQVRSRFEEESLSGALAFNLPVAHQSAPGLPFGGVGGSGFGRYHGEHSIQEFSHERPVLSKPLRPDTLAMLYPPSTWWKRLVNDRVLTRLMGVRKDA